MTEKAGLSHAYSEFTGEQEETVKTKPALHFAPFLPMKKEIGRPGIFSPFLLGLRSEVWTAWPGCSWMFLNFSTKNTREESHLLRTCGSALPWAQCPDGRPSPCCHPAVNGACSKWHSKPHPLCHDQFGCGWQEPPASTLVLCETRSSTYLVDGQLLPTSPGVAVAVVGAPEILVQVLLAAHIVCQGRLVQCSVSNHCNNRMHKLVQSTGASAALHQHGSSLGQGAP